MFISFKLKLQKQTRLMELINITELKHRTILLYIYETFINTNSLTLRNKVVTSPREIQHIKQVSQTLDQLHIEKLVFLTI